MALPEVPAELDEDAARCLGALLDRYQLDADPEVADEFEPGFSEWVAELAAAVGTALGDDASEDEPTEV